MANYDDDFVEKFLAPWNWHDVDGALALMTDDSVWEVTRGSEPSGTLFEGTEEASGFFIPGLRDDALIGRICDGVALPVNVMVVEGVPSTRRLSELGVARVSYGAIPYVRAMKALGEDARQVLS